MPIWRWTVTADASERADRFLLLTLEAGEGDWDAEDADPDDESTRAFSRSQIQRLIESGQVTANGRPIESKAKLQAGAQVEIRFPDPAPSTLVPLNIPLETLYADAHLLIINKPAGLTVHPSPTQPQGTLVNALVARPEPLAPAGGVQRPGIVHRIDKDTSGALVVARTDEAYHGLVKLFSRHEIERTYWALVYGVPNDATGRIATTLGRSPSDRKRMAVGVKGGKDAVTHYKVTERYGKFAAAVELRLETGRTHQIRVHLTSLGHSLLADPVYGTPGPSQAKWKSLPDPVQAALAHLPGQALHARSLGFVHPVTGARVSVTAEPPAEFSALQRALRESKT